MPDTPSSATDTLMTLRTVSQEIEFIAFYSEDALKKPHPPQADIDRIKALLMTAKEDLRIVADLTASHLGIDIPLEN